MRSTQCWDTSMPPWALLIALAFAFVYFLPAGIVFATSGFNVRDPRYFRKLRADERVVQFTLNMMIELVAGYLMPGNPKGNMVSRPTPDVQIFVLI